MHIPNRLGRVLWWLWIIGLTAVFVGAAGVDLNNYRPVSGDDVWIMSASYKLATQGVFGSDLYAGFFNAEQHYFIALPVHHVLQGLIFRLSEAGIAQARWPSLGGAVLLIWVVSWLAYRWYGLLPAVLTGLLLVLWRSDLFGRIPGLPLLTLARSGRYDIGAVAWAWLAIGLLDQLLERPRKATALGLGVASGLATLTQFFGAFILPLVAIGWLWGRGRRVLTKPSTYWIIIGAALVILPYTAYALAYANDFIGQTSLKGGRASFNDPQFYLANVREEPNRFAGLVDRPWPIVIGLDDFERPISPWLLIIGALPAAIYVGWRGWRRGAKSDRLLALSLVVFEVLLILFDSTKAPLYAIILLPSICMMLAAFWTDILRWMWQAQSMLPLRLTLGALSLALLAIIVIESSRAYHVDLIEARRVSHYLDVGRTINAQLAAGTRIVGPELWWWALRDHPYLATANLWSQWQSAEQRQEQSPNFTDWMVRAQPDYLIINNDTHGYILTFPPVLQRQFWTYVERCGVRLLDFVDNSYGSTQIYQIRQVPTCR